jgi:CBS domain-containing protein
MAKILKHVTRNLVTLDAATPVRDAARLMSERNIGSVAVTERGRIAGLVTERDLIRAVLAGGLDGATPVRQAMGAVPTIASDAEEGEVAEMMRRHNTRHLLVEEGGAVVGVISMRDVIQVMLDEKQFLIGQLHTYIFGRESVAPFTETQHA